MAEALDGPFGADSDGAGMRLQGVLFIALALAWVLRNLLRSLGSRYARLVVIGAAVFFLGALGLESITSMFDEHSLWYMTEVAIEESAEIIGATIVFYAVLLKICEDVAP